MPEIEGAYYPDLKTMDEAIRLEAPTVGKFYHYEPGNGTRYEVFLSLRKDVGAEHEDYLPKVGISIMNFNRPCSMIIPWKSSLQHYDIDYMCEKMGILNGDAYALIPLINRFLSET